MDLQLGMKLPGATIVVGLLLIDGEFVGAD